MNKLIENWFTYHAPTERQQAAYSVIRDTARSLAYVIVENTPPSADQSAALRKLRECVMTAHAAIACEEPAVGTQTTEKP